MSMSVFIKHWVSFRHGSCTAVQGFMMPCHFGLYLTFPVKIQNLPLLYWKSFDCSTEGFRLCCWIGGMFWEFCRVRILGCLESQMWKGACLEDTCLYETACKVVSVLTWGVRQIILIQKLLMSWVPCESPPLGSFFNFLKNWDCFQTNHTTYGGVLPLSNRFSRSFILCKMTRVSLQTAWLA